LAKEVRARYPIENEIHYLPLDAARDDIPGSYDLILASNMLHCFDAPVRSQLLERLYQALNPGGSLVVQAQYLQDNRLGGRWAIYVDLNLLCTTERGQNHTAEETRRWLEEAGFIAIEYCSMSIYSANGYVRGYKPVEAL
jgi:SAM-dependent methyltransferase